ncbi:Low-density lipoprotein receptor-related protein 2 [Araneus ventricosus]|uniref:Low-density lipoprotein receptor-related protein 2 n=1 Tax=Araneus ventricosus TaxID=182803 RepID=A0A4Y2IQR6_ARAVE|nr:Low-density lipoprotein receptor-related protein 2 [Araneus ventricosus]
MENSLLMYLDFSNSFLDSFECSSLPPLILTVATMSQTVSLGIVLASLVAVVFLHYAEAACSASDLKCTNGECITADLFCNKDDDCGNDSDESYCDVDPATPCPPGWDRCPDMRRCIPSYWMCDGVADCNGISEEENCATCSPAAFRCTNGKCVTDGSFCTDNDECGDNSDESYCDVDPVTPCPPGWDRCPDMRRCIPSHWMCDGWQHCSGTSEEANCSSCSPKAFTCSNGKCKQRHSFCDGFNDCGDNSDERYCDVDPATPCPPGWDRCPDMRRCIPSYWICDGWQHCSGTSEEVECGNDTVKMPDTTAAKTKLKSWFLQRRKLGPRTERWGSQVHRIVVALHLVDDSIFHPGNSTGEEIRYELRIQLLRRLAKSKLLSLQELALYIHGLLVTCMDPRDFYGDDLVRQLRNRVEASGNYTNPFLILALCNAGDDMTTGDLERVTTAYDSQHRPFWTDSQALSIMALSCISSRSGVSVDEHTLENMLQELKRRQFRNGTVDNFRTTALVTQALFIHDSYKEDFDLHSAIKVLMDGLNGRKSLLDAYYVLPVLNRKSLLNVSSSHCRKEPIADEEALKKMLDVDGESITVQYSIWMGDTINLARTWRLRMRVNSTIYDAIETVAKIDNRQRVEYNVVDGKPYVTSLNGMQDDPEMGTYWFVYQKSLKSDDAAKIVEQSPVDIKLQPHLEIILWYKRAPWSGHSFLQKPITSS